MTFPVAIAGDPAPASPPRQCEGPDLDDFLAEQDSLRRAMPIQRLLGSGMHYNDALTLHAAVDAQVRWDDCAEWLGERNMRLARVAGTAASARMWYRFASTCFRAAQASISVDTDRKRELFSRMVESFGAAAELDIPATTKLTIPWRGGFLCGWLLRPPGERPVPAVIIMGGFDGWREEYYLGAIALVERGIAALLVDGPGQGETRLFHGLYLDQNFPDAFSSLADHLRVHCGLGPQIGIWGNSLGGFLAAKSAATYPSQFNALCVNGGTTRPIELPERFPRFFEKVEALVGTKNRAAIIDLMDGIEMREDIAKITCPLLQLHGAPDQVFLLENARLIFDDATSDDKRLLIWEDGDHCLYNHSDEKNALITDWFASQFQAHNYKEFV